MALGTHLREDLAGEKKYNLGQARDLLSAAVKDQSQNGECSKERGQGPLDWTDSGILRPTGQANAMNTKEGLGFFEHTKISLHGVTNATAKHNTHGTLWLHRFCT